MIDEGDLGIELEYLDGIYQPRSRLNDKESDEALPILIERHGSICYYCHQESWILKIKDEAVREAKGLPPRKRPILVVHEIVRGIFHTTIVKDGQAQHIRWGGCRPACYSCNIKLRTVEPKLIDKKTMTWQAKMSLKRNEYKKIVDNYLAKKVHICKKLAINYLSNEEKLNCSQELLEEATKQNIGVQWDIININDFNIDCRYCRDQKYYGNEEHIILKGKPPQKRETDIERMLSEDQFDTSSFS